MNIKREKLILEKNNTAIELWKKKVVGEKCFIHVLVTILLHLFLHPLQSNEIMAVSLSSFAINSMDIHLQLSSTKIYGCMEQHATGHDPISSLVM